MDWLGGMVSTDGMHEWGVRVTCMGEVNTWAKHARVNVLWGVWDQ